MVGLAVAGLQIDVFQGWMKQLKKTRLRWRFQFGAFWAVLASRDFSRRGERTADWDMVRMVHDSYYRLNHIMGEIKWR